MHHRKLCADRDFRYILYRMELLQTQQVLAARGRRIYYLLPLSFTPKAYNAVNGEQQYLLRARITFLANRMTKDSQILLFHNTVYAFSRFAFRSVWVNEV